MNRPEQLYVCDLPACIALVMSRLAIRQNAATPVVTDGVAYRVTAVETQKYRS